MKHQIIFFDFQKENQKVQENINVLIIWVHFFKLDLYKWHIRLVPCLYLPLLCILSGLIWRILNDFIPSHSWHHRDSFSFSSHPLLELFWQMRDNLKICKTNDKNVMTNISSRLGYLLSTIKFFPHNKVYIHAGKGQNIEVKGRKKPNVSFYTNGCEQY